MRARDATVSGVWRAHSGADGHGDPCGRRARRIMHTGGPGPGPSRRGRAVECVEYFIPACRPRGEEFGGVPLADDLHRVKPVSPLRLGLVDSDATLLTTRSSVGLGVDRASLHLAADDYTEIIAFRSQMMWIQAASEITAEIDIKKVVTRLRHQVSIFPA